VINAVLLRPLPYPHSEQLVLLRERLLGRAGFESGSVSYMNYLDWRAAQKSFTDLALARAERVSVSASDGTSPPEATRAGRVSAKLRRFSAAGRFARRSRFSVAWESRSFFMSRPLETGTDVEAGNRGA